MNKSHWNLSSEVVQRHSFATGFQVSLKVPCKHLYKRMSPETIDLIQQIMAPEQFSRVNSQTWQRRELLLPQAKRYRHPLQSIVRHPLQSMDRCWDNQAFSRNISSAKRKRSALISTKYPYGRFLSLGTLYLENPSGTPLSTVVRCCVESVHSQNSHPATCQLQSQA